MLCWLPDMERCCPSKYGSAAGSLTAVWRGWELFLMWNQFISIPTPGTNSALLILANNLILARNRNHVISAIATLSSKTFAIVNPVLAIPHIMYPSWSGRPVHLSTC